MRSREADSIAQKKKSDEDAMNQSLPVSRPLSMASLQKECLKALYSSFHIVILLLGVYTENIQYDGNFSIQFICHEPLSDIWELTNSQ